MQKNDATCKIFPTTFRGFVEVWYHNLESDFIFGLHDLCARLIYCFNTSFSAKTFFTITQREDKH